jgi:hypothetical protein
MACATMYLYVPMLLVVEDTSGDFLHDIASYLHAREAMNTSNTQLCCDKKYNL